MKLLITGCFGFIGFNFLNLILSEKSKDFNIIGVDSLESASSRKNSEMIKRNKNFTFIESNINDLHQKKIDNLDLIINFAAESHVDNSIYNPGLFIDSNVKGVSSLLNFAIKNDINNFLHVSTDEVYGSTKSKFNIETDNFKPSSPYSASKASAELLISSFQKTFGYKTTIVRPANNYGIYQQPEKLIPFSIANLYNGGNIELYGKGDNIRHWLHVKDTTLAILHIIEYGKKGDVYNIGSEYYLSNKEVAKKILTNLDLNNERLEYVADRPGHDFRYAVNIDKLKNLGWKPKADFDEEINKIVNWYLENKDWWITDYQSILKNKRNKRMGKFT